MQAAVGSAQTGKPYRCMKAVLCPKFQHSTMWQMHIICHAMQCNAVTWQLTDNWVLVERCGRDKVG